MRHVWNDQKDLITARDDVEREAAAENICAREVLEVLALRQGAHAAEARNYADRVIQAVGWWKENSKEAYLSGFEAASLALKNYFDSRNGTRKGPQVNWPKPKRKHRGRESVGFTTGSIEILNRHHVQLSTATLNEHGETFNVSTAGTNAMATLCVASRSRQGRKSSM